MNADSACYRALFLMASSTPKATEAQQTHYPAVDIFFNTKLLHPFHVAAEATLREPNPIYMRSNLPGTGYIHFCDSEKGGGQGNALTGHIYVIN